MKNITAVFCALLALMFSKVGMSDDQNRITFCATGPYADCTQARSCSLLDETRVDCICKVAQGESVTAGACLAATPETMQSRYPGVPAMGVCTSPTNTWADCLGVVCGKADEQGNSQCACKVAKSEEGSSTQYVIVGVGWESRKQACQTGIYNSSATPGQVFDATIVLRRAKLKSNLGATDDPAVSWVYPVENEQ